MAHREVVSNAIENIAFRLAEKGSGTIAPAELLPYLPVSIELIVDVLNEAAEESEAITAQTNEGLKRYEFKPAQPEGEGPAKLAVSQCVVCDKDVSARNHVLLCDDCDNDLKTALITEAETNGWPAQAIYEHEICYLATQVTSPVSAEKLASSSRFTLRRMRKKLELMQEASAVREERDANGLRLYTFAPTTYPRERYVQNIQWIRSLPASITEEVETRVVHIFIALGILFLLLLFLAFWGFPFPLLFMVFLITSPILAVIIWKHRSKLDSMEIN